MHKDKLEIRGTHRYCIVDYVKELGGSPKNETGLFAGDNWECHISEESFFRFLQSDVPKVNVIFTAKEEAVLKEVLRQFRLKTFRAGG